MARQRRRVPLWRTHADADPLTMPDGGHEVWVKSADGVRLHAEVHGPDDAPTIVLAHGITMQERHWAYQVRDLADRYRVVVYDQRGHGRSVCRDPRAFSVDALGHDLHAVLTTCVPDGERVVVAGHSMGGITIMSWANLYPGQVADRVAAAVLFNTAPSAILNHVAVIGLPARTHGLGLAVVRRSLLSIVLRRARLGLRMLALGDRVDRVHLDALVELTAAAPATTIHALIRTLADMDLSGELAKLTVPAVLVSGTRDRLLPPVHHRRLAWGLPNVDQHIVLPGSGHMSPWEERAACSQILADVAARYLSGAPAPAAVDELGA